MIPRLVHPVSVQLEQVDGAATTYDSVYQQPVGAPAKRTVNLVGQVSTQRGQALALGPAGNGSTANALGHVVFEIDALAAAGVVLHLGDRIVSCAGSAVSWRVLRLEDHAHYGGRAHHRWAFFGPEDA